MALVLVDLLKEEHVDLDLRTRSLEPALRRLVGLLESGTRTIFSPFGSEYSRRPPASVTKVNGLGTPGAAQSNAAVR